VFTKLDCDNRFTQSFNQPFCLNHTGYSFNQKQALASRHCKVSSYVKISYIRSVVLEICCKLCPLPRPIIFFKIKLDVVRWHQKLDWTGFLRENKESCERQKVLESLQHYMSTFWYRRRQLMMMKFYFKNIKLYNANQCILRTHTNKHWSEVNRAI